MREPFSLSEVPTIPDQFEHVQLPEVELGQLWHGLTTPQKH